MNVPANSSAFRPSSSSAAGRVRKSLDRVRLFTPDGDAPARVPKPRARLAPVSSSLDDDLESAPSATTGDRTSFLPPSGSGRPALVPNVLVPFLQEVHARSNPELLERRIETATRSLAAATLVTAVVLVVASSIHFRAPSVTTTPPPPDPAATGPAAPAAPTATATETATAMREALAVLHSFLSASTADARRQAIGTSEPLPAVLTDTTRPAALPRSAVPTENARLLRAGSVQVVLVPLTDGIGLPRTAAVVHQGDRWRVDWRSLITPESLAWPEWFDSATRGPTQFRVLLSRRPNGDWSLARPDAKVTDLTALTAPGSRVAAELEAALAARNGQPLSADLFLTFDSARTLNIVGWTPDKWSL